MKGADKREKPGLEVAPGPADGKGLSKETVFDRFVRFICEEKGEQFVEMDRKGDAVLCVTWEQIDPYDVVDHVVRRDIIYHVWQGNKRLFVTEDLKDAEEYWYRLAGRWWFLKR